MLLARGQDALSCHWRLKPRPGRRTPKKQWPQLDKQALSSAGGCVPTPLHPPSYFLCPIRCPRPCSRLTLVSSECFHIFSFGRGQRESKIQEAGQQMDRYQKARSPHPPAAIINVFYFFPSAGQSKTHTNSVSTINISSPDLCLCVLESP